MYRHSQPLPPPCRGLGEHLENSQRFIEVGIAECSNRGKAVVFGAGLIYDLPLAALSTAFDEVVLVDLVHLRPARQAARHWPNIRLVECDLTASLAGLFQGRTELATPDDFLDDAAVGYVVSSNVVSQLPVLPLEWLTRRFGLDDAAGQRLAGLMVQGHLDYLGRFDGPVCLISDQTRVYCTADVEEVAREDALYGIDPGPVNARWNWQIAPLGELDRRYGVSNEVIAAYL